MPLIADLRHALARWRPGTPADPVVPPAPDAPPADVATEVAPVAPDLGGLVVTERFHSDTPDLALVCLDLSALSLDQASPLTLSVLRPGDGDYRQVFLRDWSRCLDPARFELGFPPFRNDAGDLFHLFIHQTEAPPSFAALAEATAVLDLTTRPPPIRLQAPWPKPVVPAAVADDPQDEGPAFRLIYGLERFWCDRHGVYVEGWVHCYEHAVRAIAVHVGSDSYTLPGIGRRDDLLAFYPEHAHVVDSGFSAYLDCVPGHPVILEVRTDAGTRRVALDLPRGGTLHGSWTEIDLVDKRSDFYFTLQRFVHEVNDRHLVVAEIGSRVVGDASHDRRRYFDRARRFVGIDIHGAPGVDVAGDAHRLDELVGRGGIDAVFSFSVLEHLSHPWVLAAATNRALSLGGLVFHSAPQTYPLHEQPNDFWRFSDEGLKLLFGPDTGFEVLAAGMVSRMEIHPEDRRGPFALLPLNPGYGNAYILARKVRDLPDGAVAWPGRAEESAARAALYPNRAASAEPGSEHDQRTPEPGGRMPR